MYGKHEQEMALNVNNFREWILALPPSLTADALTSALKAWTTLMANAGLSVSLDLFSSVAIGHFVTGITF